jgi:hypothetical protein
MNAGLAALLLTGVLMAAGRPGADAPAKDQDDSIEVKVRGTLRAGMVAIGAETTGFTISARGVTWELDFGKNTALKNQAEGLHGKTVIVTGTLEARPGVEIATRSIVTVDSLVAATAPPAKTK